MTGGRLSLAPEDGLLGTHAIDAVPGFSLRESAIIGSSHKQFAGVTMPDFRIPCLLIC